LPGRPDKNPAMAEYCFKMHKYAGLALEYAVAAHVAGFVAHALVGYNLMHRMSGPVGSLFLALPWVAVAATCAYTA